MVILQRTRLVFSTCRSFSLRVDLSGLVRGCEGGGVAALRCCRCPSPIRWGPFWGGSRALAAITYVRLDRYYSTGITRLGGLAVRIGSFDAHLARPRMCAEIGCHGVMESWNHHPPVPFHFFSFFLPLQNPAAPTASRRLSCSRAGSSFSCRLVSCQLNYPLPRAVLCLLHGARRSSIANRRSLAGTGGATGNMADCTAGPGGYVVGVRNIAVVQP